MTDFNFLRKNSSDRTKYTWNEIIFLIVLLCASCECTSKPDNCSPSKTCKTCTEKPACQWSMVQQTCFSADQISDGWDIVHNKTYCPIFSSTVKETFLNEDFNLRIKVSNDPMNFLGYMRRNIITFGVGHKNLSITGSVIENEIVSGLVGVSRLSENPGLYFFYPKLNNVTLKFDDYADHYLVAYRDKNCVNKTYEDCVTCLWNADDKRNYLKWCSSYKPCLSSQEMYREQPDTFAGTVSEPVVPADTVHVKCPELRVVSVEPSYGLWTGRTTVTITVNNHRISAKNRTVTVTVAGHECSDPKTVDDRTITCSASAADRTTGPVLVRYGPRFAVESAMNFSFVESEVLDSRSRCVPQNGSRTLTVVGDWLDAGADVRVTLGENGTTRCAIAVRNRNRIECRIDPDIAAGSDDGVVRLEYDGGARFEYPSTPYRLQVLDMDRMAGIASGGTAIPVRGTGFSCVRNPTVQVYRNGKTYRAGCDAVNDTYLECRSPKFDDPVAESATLRCDLRGGGPGDERVYRESDYRLYADPVFSDFVLANDDDTDVPTIVLNGLDPMNEGYGIEDLRIRLPNSTDDCSITYFTRQSIRCLLNRTVSTDDLQRVIVTVGGNRGYVVKNKFSVPPTTGSPFPAGKFITTLSVLLLFFIVASALVVFLLLRGTKKSWRCRPEHSEQRQQNVEPKNLIEMDDCKS